MIDRLTRVRTLLDALNLDAVIVTSGTNRRYLTGFTAEDHAPDESSGIVLIDRTSATLLASPTNLPWAHAEIGHGVEAVAWERPWATSVASRALARDWHRVGFEERVTPTADYFALIESLRSSVELVQIGSSLDDLRGVKEPGELDLLKRALALTDEAFVAAEARVRAGLTERDVVEIVRDELKRVGSDGEGFDTIVASGPNAAKPHHAPGNRSLQESEPIIIDMGAQVDGYKGDLTRTIWLGQPSERLVTMYNTVAEAMRHSVNMYVSGARGADIDLRIREFFEARGLREYFVHGLGHGIGLRIHEAPSVGPASSDMLAIGHVVTTEPGIYIPDWGGVRIENVVAVTADGPVNLTHAPIREV